MVGIFLRIPRDRRIGCNGWNFFRDRRVRGKPSRTLKTVANVGHRRDLERTWQNVGRRVENAIERCNQERTLDKVENVGRSQVLRRTLEYVGVLVGAPPPDSYHRQVGYVV